MLSAVVEWIVPVWPHLSLLLPMFFFPTCDCCDTTVECTETTGECPDGVPEVYRITVSGITDGTCASCDDYNGTFDLIFNGLIGNCGWNSDELPACGPATTQRRWELQARNAGEWNLQNYIHTVQIGHSYYGSAASWDCFGTSTVSETVFSNGACLTYPATIDVEAV